MITKNISLYTVAANLPTETLYLYYGSDIEAALVEFESASEQTEYTEQGTIELLVTECTYEFLLDEDELEYFPIESEYSDCEIWQLIDSEEPVIIASGDVNLVNQKSDAILQDVDQHFKNVYGQYKYNEFFVNDDKIVVLRIADHTENIYNNDRYNYAADYIISVVIADTDATAERFGTANQLERRSNEMSMSFNSEYNAEQIIKIITTSINAINEK